MIEAPYTLPAIEAELTRLGVDYGTSAFHTFWHIVSDRADCRHFNSKEPYIGDVTVARVPLHDFLDLNKLFAYHLNDPGYGHIFREVGKYQRECYSDKAQAYMQQEIFGVLMPDLLHFCIEAERHYPVCMVTLTLKGDIDTVQARLRTLYGGDAQCFPVQHKAYWDFHGYYNEAGTAFYHTGKLRDKPGKQLSEEARAFRAEVTAFYRPAKLRALQDLLDESNP